MGPPRDSTFESRHLKQHEHLGQGSYGSVYRVTYRNERWEMAAKTFIVGGGHIRKEGHQRQHGLDYLKDRNQKVAELLREFDAAHDLEHDNVVNVYGVCTDHHDWVGLLMEYVPRGSLRRLLNTAPETVTGSEAMQLKLAHGIAAGMAYLHGLAPQMLHHDLKSENVLIGEGDVAKVADFGLATGISGSTTLMTTRANVAGTLACKAPECFDDAPFNAPCDVYAFGIVAWELVTGQVPWKHYSEARLGMTVYGKKERPPLDGTQKASFVGGLAQHCWAHEPGERPTFATIEQDCAEKLAPPKARRATTAEGLREFLQECELESKLDVAKAFCEKKGATFFDQIVKHKLVDGLVDALELKEVEKGRLLKKINLRRGGDSSAWRGGWRGLFGVAGGGDSSASPAATVQSELVAVVKAEFAQMNRRLSGVAADTGKLVSLYTHLAADTAVIAAHTDLAPNVIDAVKAATVRIGLLNVSTWKLIELGSGTIVDGGAGWPTNQVLSAAHLFIEPNPGISFTSPRWKKEAAFLSPKWVKFGMPVDIDWTSDTAPLILAIGMWEGDDKPSKWMYWAELVTPLATLQELRESPDGARTGLLDLAVLRIRGRLELNPSEYTRGELRTTYALTKKHAASDLSLPAGRPLGNPVKTYKNKVTCFGWFAPNRELTLHVPDSAVVESLERELIMSQVVLHQAGSGGATVDHRGCIVGVNSRSDPPGMPGSKAREDYKSYMRMVNQLLPAHGLEWDGFEGERSHATTTNSE